VTARRAVKIDRVLKVNLEKFVRGIFRINFVATIAVAFALLFVSPNVAMAKTNEKKSAKKHTISLTTQTKIAIGLDVLGVAAIGYGIYQNSQMNSHLDRAKIYNRIDPEYEKAADAHTARNISYIAGSVLLASGIGIHIYF